VLYHLHPITLRFHARLGEADVRSSPPSVRSAVGTPLRLLFRGSREIRSLTYPDRCVSSRGVRWWGSRRRKVHRRRAMAGQSAAPASVPVTSGVKLTVGPSSQPWGYQIWVHVAWVRV
jgi:hypothetical protein